MKTILLAIAAIIPAAVSVSVALSASAGSVISWNKSELEAARERAASQKIKAASFELVMQNLSKSAQDCDVEFSAVVLNERGAQEERRIPVAQLRLPAFEGRTLAPDLRIQAVNLVANAGDIVPGSFKAAATCNGVPVTMRAD